MSITLENSTNKVIFGGDASIERESPDVLVVPGTFKAEELQATAAGVRFPDNSLQTTASTGGGSSSGVMYDNTSRYQVYTVTGQFASVTSTSPVRYGLSWIRSDTDLTITDVSHNHVTGDRVIVRNTNLNYQVALITATTTDTFTFVTVATGGTSGALGAYSMGYTFAANGATGSITGGTLSAPSGVTNIQMLGLRIHMAANTRLGSTYSIVIPNQIDGAWSGMDNIIIPLYSVRNDSNTLGGVSATISANVSGNWQTFQLGALGAVTTGLQIVLGF